MNKHLEIKQSGFKDCASACLLSIMRYYKMDASLDEISFILKTDNNGTNAYNLINGARSLGFDGYGIHYSYEEIISNKVNYPLICHVIEESMYHFIVVYEVNTKKNIIYAMDPAYGNVKIKFDKFKNIYQNTSIVLFPVNKLYSLTKKRTIFDFIYSYLKIEIKSFLKVFTLSIIVIFLSLISNLYMKIIVDNVIVNFSYRIFLCITIFFLNILLSKSIIDYIRGKYLIKVVNKISMIINSDILNHLFNLPYQFFKNKPTGEVMNRVNDIKNFREIFSEIIVSISMDLILILISMIVLLIINAKLFLIVVVSMILYFAVVTLYSKIFKSKIEQFKINEGKYNKILLESIEGYETNKNLNMINYVNKKVNIQYNTYVNSFSLYESLLNNQILIKNIIDNISYIIIIFIGVIYIKNNIITLGSFILFTNIVIYFTEPIKSILDLEPNFSYVNETYQRINNLLLMKAKYLNNTTEMIGGDISISNLKFSYNNIDDLFDNVNINIKYRSRYLIYGHSGSGKSTIMKILLKYIEDYKGEIKINNVNIKDIDASLIMSSFTYVSQNNYINNDTLINNIVFDRNVSNDEYENVIRITNIDKFRNSSPLRNNFMIEENGFNISGGERQKIILSKALLKSSNFIILDEALSEVGEIEEKEILEKIFNYYKDKTIIYITHKKEIIKLFDQKYYLERKAL